MKKEILSYKEIFNFMQLVSKPIYCYFVELWFFLRETGNINMEYREARKNSGVGLEL
jgi:hypothetical protein